MHVSRKLAKILLPTFSRAEQHSDILWASKNVAKSKYFEMALAVKRGCQEKRRECIQRLLTLLPVRIFQGVAAMHQVFKTYGPTALLQQIFIFNN